ncbi:hypothetical protein SSIN_0416 [Streptococcus sinensis]|uniref:Uncharacterized protein n=1 Tax=Streptococcus sinensis TaxID=176090 RepID=A0A0A0DI33_9STRE|nr:hypothetical protein SSIN_0416 [Streptococcus sinensis]
MFSLLSKYHFCCASLLCSTVFFEDSQLHSYFKKKKQF